MVIRVGHNSSAAFLIKNQTDIQGDPGGRFSISGGDNIDYSEKTFLNNMPNFSLPPLRKQDLISSGLLRSE